MASRCGWRCSTWSPDGEGAEHGPHPDPKRPHPRPESRPRSRAGLGGAPARRRSRRGPRDGRQSDSRSGRRDPRRRGRLGPTRIDRPPYASARTRTGVQGGSGVGRYGRGRRWIHPGRLHGEHVARQRRPLGHEIHPRSRCEGFAREGPSDRCRDARAPGRSDDRDGRTARGRRGRVQRRRRDDLGRVGDATRARVLEDGERRGDRTRGRLRVARCGRRQRGAGFDEARSAGKPGRRRRDHGGERHPARFSDRGASARGPRLDRGLGAHDPQGTRSGASRDGGGDPASTSP